MSAPKSKDAPPPSVQVMCPHLTCRKILSVPASARGQTVRCQHCQNVLRVPEAKADAA